MNAQHKDYASRCARLYANNQFFNSDVEDKQNDWLAAKKALSDFSIKEQTILLKIYAGNSSIVRNIFNISKKLHLDKARIWSTLRRYTKAIAKNRGLL